MTRLQILSAFLTTLLASAPALAVYSPELGRWRQRDPIGYADGTNVYQYVQARPVVALDPLGLKLTVEGNRAYRDSVEDALREICPDAGISDDGSVFIACPTQSGNSEGCDCLTKLANSSNEHVIKDGDPGVGPYTDPANPGDASTTGPGTDLEGPPAPGAGTGSQINWDPSTTYSPDPEDSKSRSRIPDSIILAHELCGHAQEFDLGTDAGDPPPGTPPTAIPQFEVGPIMIENIIRREMGYPPRGPVYPF